MVEIEEGFSYQELKSRLLDKLHNGGIHDKLLSQLRSKLFSELSLATRIKPSLNNTNELLISKVVDSLFVDYLSTRGLEFSLSVFLPESGLDSVTKALNESDMIRALHLQRPNTAVLLTNGEGSFITRLLTCLSNFNDKPTMEKEIQTNVEVDDLMHIKLRDLDKTIRSRAVQYDNSQSLLLEERMYSFQRDLETASARQLEQQLENFKRVELAKLKLEEKTLLHGQLQSQKLDYESKLLAAEARSTEIIQEERARLLQREKEMDRQNLMLKQQLLDEHNNIIFKERQLRNEMELESKQISLERDQLKQRVTEVQQQLDKLSEFKEKYTQRMEESMAQYKIDLNKEYSNMLSAVQIEKTKLHGDRMILQEKEAAAEKMLANLSKTEQDAMRYRKELNVALSKVDELTREKDTLLAKINDLQLQILTNKGTSSLEYEIASLKKQLDAAEKANTQKQNDYDALVKSITAKDGTDNISQVKQNELVWKQKCQELVLKLDAEFITSDELSQRLERHKLKNMELERELADTRLLLHQAQTALKLAQTVDYIPKPSYISAESDLDTDHYNRYANSSIEQSRSFNSHKTIPLPSQFDIHGRESPAKDRSDIHSRESPVKDRVESAAISPIPVKDRNEIAVITPSKISKLPVRIPAAFKEGRGLTRSPSADLKSSNPELHNSSPDLHSLSKSDLRGKLMSKSGLQGSNPEMKRLAKSSDPDIRKSLSNTDLRGKECLGNETIVNNLENLVRERQALLSPLRQGSEAVATKTENAKSSEESEKINEANSKKVDEMKKIEEENAKKLVETKKVEEENERKKQDELEKQQKQTEQKRKEAELQKIDNLVDPQLQRYIDIVKKNRNEEFKVKEVEEAVIDNFGAGETDQELSAPENVSSSDPSW